MAVAYISDADNTTTGNDLVFSGFAVSGTNPVIIVIIQFDDASVTFTSVSVGSGLTSGTPVEVKFVRNSTTAIAIWAIPAPSGTGTITCTPTGAIANAKYAQAVLLQGAHQTTPCPAADAASNTSTGTPISVTCTNVSANDAIVGAGAVVGGDAPTWTTGTQITNINTGSINIAAGYRLGNGTGTCTFGVAGTNAIAAVRIADVNAGSTSPIVDQRIGMERPFNMAAGRR